MFSLRKIRRDACFADLKVQPAGFVVSFSRVHVSCECMCMEDTWQTKMWNKSCDADSASPADVPVRMALGETHVIALTKRALGEAGVNVDALETAAAASGKAAAQMRVERSGTALLVKNLPYSASEPELQVFSHRMT